MKKMFKNKILTILLLFTFSLTCIAVFATPPTPNLSILKKELVKYHDSGEYFRDIAYELKSAKSYIDKRLKANNREKLAIVFDIDETLISCYQMVKDNDFGDTPALITAIFLAHNLSGISPAIDLYNYAKEHDITVYLITGRKEKYRITTEKNLHAVGISGSKALIMEPNDYQKPSPSTFKIKARKSIEDDGYDIILNIGDQKSDLIGGYADKTIKLPNPFYLVP